jgi:hypothetical protein
LFEELWISSTKAEALNALAPPESHLNIAVGLKFAYLEGELPKSLY